MIRAISIPLDLSIAADPAGLAEAFATIASLLRELVRGFFDPYRPERHYMRGPGPKWHELHG